MGIGSSRKGPELAVVSAELGTPRVISSQPTKLTSC